jgi:hypothetical protein
LVAVRVTVRLPALIYVWSGLWVVEVVPSPKSHFHDVGLLVLLSVNCTFNGIDPVVGDAEKAATGVFATDLPQMSSKKEHFFCYRFQVITSKSETIISILTPKNRSEKSSAESQSRKM